ncbi:rhodanese-like domain-containing protein [Kitasatospora brasiliensis]|uniref:rhodanese-like domain-containing protein n=1 Tax=Kitasatospora brasiliensis TaxID=3058040 RepID=UPI00292D9376|nr:rhodanese-like domain-containing protein [Kitasatospora sp. K002]
MTTPLTVEQFQPRLGQLTLIDVRSPGEYAAGHIPGALNIPLDQLDRALPALREAAAQNEIAVVCAAGPRAENACRQLADAGIPTLTLTGGTNAWAGAGRPLNQVTGARKVWALDRQVRLVAGSLVIAGVLVDLALPGARWFSAAVGGGLAFSALSNTCAMGSMLSKLPFNRPRPGTPGLEQTLANLKSCPIEC